MATQRRKSTGYGRAEPQGPLGHLHQEAIDKRHLGYLRTAKLLNAAIKQETGEAASITRSSLRNWISRWVIPQPDTQRALLAVLGIPERKLVHAIEAQHAARAELRERSAPIDVMSTGNKSDDSRGVDDATRIVTWLRETNATDDAIEQIERASISLAEAHAEVPAKNALGDALRIHRYTQAILRGGKQRLGQTRDLLRVDSYLLAHICLLLGDLGRNDRAAQYGSAAQLYAQEAAVNEAIAWSVRAKTARWQQRYIESADMARHGFEISQPTPTRIELAYREANAAALLGDTSRARESLRRAEETAETVPVNDVDRSVWSFPVPRQAVFAISVAIHTGDPDAALRAAAMADAAWATDARRIPANWAQVRAGAAIAHLMKGALDGTFEQTAQVLDLPKELRIDTVIGYLKDLDHRLADRRFANDRTASELRERIREFSLAATLDDDVAENE